jgi:hypothetical protein
MKVQTHRRGAKWEAVGFLLILTGIGICFANAGIGAILILVGFIVFIIGRFL